MLCENCGKNEANVRYTEIINGNKKEMHLCEECSQKLGISSKEFKMPINFSSFLGEFFDDFEPNSFLPEFNPIKELQCDNCGMTFEDFMNTGKFGCSNCYDAFESKIDPILKNIHGANRHIGRLGEISSVTKQESKTKTDEKENKKQCELEKFQKELQKAIKEERYEDAAKIRDKIKKLNDSKK